MTYFKSATKCDINCPIKVVFNAQIVLKRVFQAGSYFMLHFLPFIVEMNAPSLYI